MLKESSKKKHCIIATSPFYGQVPIFYLYLALELLSKNIITIFILDGKHNNLDEYQVKYRKLIFYTWPSKRPTKLADFLFGFKVYWAYKGEVLFSLSNFGSHNILSILSFLFQIGNNFNYQHTSVGQIMTDSKSSFAAKFTLYFLLFRKKQIMKLNTHVFTNSEYMRLDIRNSFDFHETSVLHLKISEGRLSIRENKRVTDSIQLLIIARLDKSKGHAQLLRVFKQLLDKKMDATLHIIGNGEEFGNLELLSTQLAVKSLIKFYGKLNRSDVDEILRNSDILISASVYEAFGLTMIEAFSNGIPVIATRTEGALEIIDDFKDGRFYDSEDAESFISAVEDISKNLTFYSKNALNKFNKKFSLSTIADSVDHILEHCK